MTQRILDRYISQSPHHDNRNPVLTLPLLASEPVTEYITTSKMSGYGNKGEKDFGEGPKVHRIRITLTSRSTCWSQRVVGIEKDNG